MFNNFVDKVLIDLVQGDYIDIPDYNFEYNRDMYDFSLFSSDYNNVQANDRWYLTFKMSTFWPFASHILILERDGMQLDLNKEESKALRKKFLKIIDYEIQRYYDRKRKSKEWQIS